MPGLSVALATATALCALAVCQYRYGIFDQAQYLVGVVGMQDPGALGDDPYLGAFGALRSVLWPIVAAATDEASRPLFCLLIALAVTVANVLLLSALGRALLDASGAASRAAPLTVLLAVLAPALVLVVPKEQNWFGLVSLGDVELTATLAVLPLVFASMLAWVRGRPWISLLLAAAALPVHGQTGAYLLTAWWVAAAWDGRSSPVRLAAVALIGAIGAGAVALERGAVALADEQVLALEEVGRGLYAELIDPRTGPLTAWCAVATILLLGLVPAARRVVRARPAPERRLLVWWAASAAFPLAGLTLLEFGADEALLWRLMIGRSLMLPQIAALVVFSVWTMRALAAGRRRAVAAVVCLVLVVAWPVAQVPLPVVAAGLGLVLALLALNPAPSWPDAGLSTPARRRVCAGAVTALAVVGALGIVHFEQRPYPWLASGQDTAWGETQRWARNASAPGTLFLTPPYLSGWRVDSHRPTFGEVKDGGLLFYAGEPALGWAHRMRQLGMEPSFRLAEPAAASARSLHLSRRAYQAALERGGHALVAWTGAAYVVLERTHDVEMGAAVWSNDAFVVRSVDGTVVAAIEP
ncbi:MAG: hypothetical protein GY715_05290 [Planctomycetes bacterium]|nr:hypothetical protein [Planctomycetota bacterium]